MAASKMVVPGSVSLGSILQIRINRDSSKYVHQLDYIFGSGTTTRMATGVGTSYNFDTSLVKDHFISKSSDTMQIVCTTIDSTNNQRIGISFANVIINANGVPTINSISVTPINDNAVIQGWDSGNIFVQGYTKLKIDVDCTAPYGATISSCRIVVNGQTVGESAATSFTAGTPIMDSGSVTISATVVDSRNNKTTGNTTINVYPYSRPYASVASALRYSSNVNTEDKNGTNLSAKATIVSSSVNGHNAAYVKVRYKQSGGTYPTSTTTLTSGAANHEKINSAAISADASYVVQFIIYDKLNTESANPTTLELIIPTNAVVLHSMDGGSGLGIGGYQTKTDAIQLFLDTYMSGKLIFDSTAVYGTGAPPTSGVTNGQVYFQLID